MKSRKSAFKVLARKVLEAAREHQEILEKSTQKSSAPEGSRYAAELVEIVRPTMREFVNFRCGLETAAMDGTDNDRALAKRVCDFAEEIVAEDLGKAIAMGFTFGGNSTGPSKTDAEGDDLTEEEVE